MKAHITLINPPQTSGAPNSGFIPLGLGYLAAVLEKEAYTVNVIDCQVQQHSIKDLETELAKLQPDVIGVTSTTLTYRSAIDIVQTARKASPDSVILMGGPHVTVLDKQVLNEQSEVDIIVRGEGETTLLELADRVTKSNMKTSPSFLSGKRIRFGFVARL